MAGQVTAERRAALVAAYQTDSAAWLAAARVMANGGPSVTVEWCDVLAADTAEAHAAQRVLCEVTDHGRHDSRGTGWWHAAGVTRHLVCVHCGAGRHGDTDPASVAGVPHSVWGGDYRMRPCHCPMSEEATR
jgi:hypothetical protein